MVTETLLSTVLQVSLTGAGLVLAIYAIVIPVLGQMLNNRAKQLIQWKTEFKENQQNLKPEDSAKLNDLQKLSKNIEEKKHVPRYLTYGVYLVFSFYMVVTFSTSMALFNPSSFDVISESIVRFLFPLTNMGFLFLGIFTILDISRTVEGEYNKIKEELTNIKKS